MPRVLIDARAVRDGSIAIRDPDTLHRLLRVLRMKVGDALECFDGAGHRYAGRVAHCARQSMVIDVAQRIDEAPPALRVTLAQGLIRPERFDWVIQKATELGVERVTPLITAHTVIRLANDQCERKVARWTRIAEEAAQQCGRATIPVIDAPQRFDRFVPTLTSYSGAVMPTLSAASRPLNQQLQDLDHWSSVAALIGPEGDFTREECLLAQRYGASLVSLGRLTLRSETAAVALLAILSCAAGVW